MNIAVLMTCHNRRETTLRCLAALADAMSEINEKHAEGTRAEFHLFLVDDGSTDGTGEAVREWFSSTVRHMSFIVLHLIPGSGSLFWAKGMARAWREAHGYDFDFFLWLNDDVQMKRAALVQVVEDWKDCGDVRGVIVGACSTDRTETKSSYGATDRQDVRIFPNQCVPQRADGWFNGNFVLVPRAAHETVGLISDAYSHARADYDYAERLKCADIPFFCSSHFVGVCVKDWAEKTKDQGLFDRVRSFWTPGYRNLADLFRFKYRYYGLGRAVISVLHMIFLSFKG